MKIVAAGGTGFLGRALTGAWRQQGHDVRVLTRHPREPNDVQWSPGSDAGEWANVVDRSDAVVNLAGENLGAGRWTPARKAALLDSRVVPTRALTEAIVRSAAPPRVFLSASAMGVYGARGGEPVTEDAAAGSDFPAEICQAWEREAIAASAVTRVVLLRTGLVLARHGGALPRIARPFRFFAGAQLGSGKQVMSWIHLHDWVEMVRWAASTPAVSGPLNVTAPGPVTNAQFTRTLAAAVHRPALFTVPGGVLRLILGEMADALLLGGQRVLPAKAERLGFAFRYRTIDDALMQIYGRRRHEGTEMFA